MGAVMSLMVGRFIDMGHGNYSVLIAYSVACVSAVVKALSFDVPWAAIAAAALGAVTASVRVPVVMARIYNLAQQSGCVLRFNMATEAGFDLGSASCCLIAAALIASGVPVGVPVLLAIPALITGAVLLWRSYSNEKV
jgi:MFS transporter, DHA1 family, inner membrane transport protein